MEYASYGTLIDFSDKTQIFSLNPNVIKTNVYHIRNFDNNWNGKQKQKSDSNNSKEKKNEFYSEEYLKKFIKQISEAMEFRN